MFYLYDNVYHLGVYNPKNLGNDKWTVTLQNLIRGVYNPKILGNDKRNATSSKCYQVFTTPKI